MQSVMRNRKVFGGAMANLNMVKAEIERLMNDYGEVLSNIQPVVNVYQIHSENNQ
jgi:ABC-type transporter Mla subunit MlaD